MEIITVAEWLRNAKSGQLEKMYALDESLCWYDWFCSDKALKNRALAFTTKLEFLVKEGVIGNPEKFTLWFKNNCPGSGSLYDDVRFNRVEDDEFVGGFCYKTGHRNAENKCYIWFIGRQGEGSYEEFNYRNWTTFKREVTEGALIGRYK